MAETIFLAQYFFLNGWLIYTFFLKDKDSSVMETILSSILLSTCINSIAFYLLIRLINLPINETNIIIMSLSLTVFIVILARAKLIIHRKS